MHKRYHFLASRLLPYFYLVLAAVIAYLPVSSTMFSLKNDVIVLEYPIQYFISQCIHNGISPLWFNTWAMGFPLEAAITWSIYSPVQVFFGTLFPFNIYTLQIEFVFFIALSGSTMFYFLKKHLVADKILALLLAICYMLSGFMVSSSQWLLDITGCAFLPLILSLALDLSKKPGWKSSLRFSLVFYCMMTSVYAALNIIIVYILIAFALYDLFRKLRFKQGDLKRTAWFAGLSILIIIILSAPCLYTSLQVLHSIQRGNPISNGVFFNSNYLHPKFLICMITPLAAPKMLFYNTEPTMMHAYVGLFPLLLLPFSIIKIIKQKQYTGYLLLFSWIFFLLVSFGDFTPFRSILNNFPGFPYFRHPGLFRLFFIFFLLLFLGNAFSKSNFSFLLKESWKPVFITAGLIFCICFLLTFLHAGALQMNQMKSFSPEAFLNAINLNELFFISSIVQMIFLLSMLYFWFRGKSNLLALTIISDLVLNTLVCTPFFTVSRFSPSQVERIFNQEERFPIQQNKLIDVPVKFDIGNAVWYNTNVYKKEVSARESYWGPLFLQSFRSASASTADYYDHLLVFGEGPGVLDIKITLQNPDHVKASLNIKDSATLFFLQNYYPGWKAFLNGSPLEIKESLQGGMKVQVRSGGTLEFKYQKKGLITTIILIHILVFSVAIVFLVSKFRDMTSREQ